MRIGTGSVAVITGGASGIGRACATEFARRGADVVVADVNEARTTETVEALRAFGVRALGVHCDVTSDRDVEDLRDRAIEVMGHVDLIMNNAGVPMIGPPERVPMEDWQRIFDVNVFGIIRGVRAFVPYFQERGSGYVVNTSSTAGLYAHNWDVIPYIATKFSAYGLSEGLHVYLKPQGIGVSVLCPGLVASNIGENALFAGVDDPAAWVQAVPTDMSLIEPDSVGPIVADGIADERFLLLTHPEDHARLRERHRDIESALARQIAQGPIPPKLPPVTLS